jgi:hypothetical protein
LASQLAIGHTVNVLSLMIDNGSKSPSGHKKLGPLDTQAPDQGKGLIVDREGRIKLHVISNLTISLDHQITLIQRSMTMVDPPTITQLQLQSLGDGINHAQVTVPQSTPTIDGHLPIDLRLASVPLPTSSFHYENSTIVLNVMLVGTPRQSRIIGSSKVEGYEKQGKRPEIPNAQIPDSCWIELIFFRLNEDHQIWKYMMVVGSK